MKFQLLPVADIMIALYQTPVSADRFTNYMKILQGNAPGDITMPVTFFNPMGKEHVLNRLKELKDLKAEEHMKTILAYINRTITSFSSKEITVSLALADDLGGGWTNRYTTDYDSKFNTNDLLKRNFCNPLFWVSEAYSEDLIKERTADYCYRVLYRSTASQPLTLEDHLEQELFVARHNPFRTSDSHMEELNKIDSFYKQHKQTTQYPTIFNFLYGDDASREIGHTAYGIKGAFPGFNYANELARKSEKV